jgi:hypothetical protein
MITIPYLQYWNPQSSNLFTIIYQLIPIINMQPPSMPSVQVVPAQQTAWG